MSKKEEQLLSPEDHERLAAAALKSEVLRGRCAVPFDTRRLQKLHPWRLMLPSGPLSITAAVCKVVLVMTAVSWCNIPLSIVTAWG